MLYLLGRKRTQFIKENFFEFSFGKDDDATADRAAFDTIKSAAEFHYLATIYNWDDGVEVLEWIVNSPLCDKGTAKLIFWLSQPDFYTRFEKEEEADFHRDVYRLLRTIIANVESGFYKRARFRFNPNSNAYNIHDVDRRAKWVIPAHMKKGVWGFHVISMADVISVAQFLGRALWREVKSSVRRTRKKLGL